MYISEEHHVTYRVTAAGVNSCKSDSPPPPTPHSFPARLPPAPVIQSSLPLRNRECMVVWQHVEDESASSGPGWAPSPEGDSQQPSPLTPRPPWQAWWISPSSLLRTQIQRFLTKLTEVPSFRGGGRRIRGGEERRGPMRDGTFQPRLSPALTWPDRLQMWTSYGSVDKVNTVHQWSHVVPVQTDTDFILYSHCH